MRKTLKERLRDRKNGINQPSLVCRFCSKEVDKEDAVFKGKKEYHSGCLARMRRANSQKTNVVGNGWTNQR